MIADPEVKMVFFTGGEVGNEILPFIDYENIKKNPKILCSYSDSTTVLNAVNHMTGLVTFYGSSPRFFEQPPIDYTLINFEKRLKSTDLEYVKNSEWRALTPGKAEGILVGGYLMNFAALLGLEWYKELPDEDIILFIEDHEKFSNASVVSKWFTTLEHHGVFKKAKALIFGHYSLEPSPVIDDILTRIGKRYNIPVIRNEDFGHGANGAILPISVRARLNTEDMSFEFLESGVQ
jgi:muramoyltetrapeptide carboxypeptidase